MSFCVANVAFGENQAWPYRALAVHKVGAAKCAVFARVTDVFLRGQHGIWWESGGKYRRDSLRRPRCASGECC